MACIFEETTLLLQTASFEMLENKTKLQTKEINKIASTVLHIDDSPLKEELQKVTCFF